MSRPRPYLLSTTSESLSVVPSFVCLKEAKVENHLHSVNLHLVNRGRGWYQMREDQTVLCGYGIKSVEKLEEEQVQAENNEFGSENCDFCERVRCPRGGG